MISCKTDCEWFVIIFRKRQNVKKLHTILLSFLIRWYFNFGISHGGRRRGGDERDASLIFLVWFDRLIRLSQLSVCRSPWSLRFLLFLCCVRGTLLRMCLDLEDDLIHIFASKLCRFYPFIDAFEGTKELDEKAEDELLINFVLECVSHGLEEMELKFWKYQLYFFFFFFGV